MLRAKLPAATKHNELNLAANFECAKIRAILLDIEGTTTPVDFVFQTLFPYAKEHAEGFLREHADDPAVKLIVEELRGEHAKAAATCPAFPKWKDAEATACAAAFVRWLIEQDSKITPLKTLQGKIWEEGYRRGELKGEIYEDVAPAFGRWREQGRRLAIFSSGSVLAQKLIFGHSTAGDLTKYLEAYFDTAAGPKRDAQSYKSIAKALGLAPMEILFISDVAVELDAARAARMLTAHSLRPGIAPQEREVHPAVRSFSEIFPEG